jgi:hypothetical protein
MMRGGAVPQSPQAAMANRPRPEDAATHITVGLKDTIMKSLCGSPRQAKKECIGPTQCCSRSLSLMCI